MQDSVHGARHEALTSSGYSGFKQGTRAHYLTDGVGRAALSDVSEHISGKASSFSATEGQKPFLVHSEYMLDLGGKQGATDAITSIAEKVGAQGDRGAARFDVDNAGRVTFDRNDVFNPSQLTQAGVGMSEKSKGSALTH